MNDSTSPRLTVLLPVLRPQPALFRRAIQSVLDQSFTAFRLLIVEDPSEAPGAEIVAEFSDDRITYLQNRSPVGFARQLNQGLQQIQTEWVARMDADDICEPQRFAAQMEYVTTHTDVDVLGSQLTVIDSEDHVIGRRDYPLDNASIRGALLLENPIAHPATLIRTRVLQGIDGFRSDVDAGVADYDLWLRLAKSGAVFATHPTPLLRYRIHSGGMKSERLQQMIRGTLAVKREHWDFPHDWRAPVRYWAEQLLLYLPKQLVLWLFQKTRLRRDGH
ncbi:MAG: glycosyltransferase [Planctomycetota bacterium]